MVKDRHPFLISSAQVLAQSEVAPRHYRLSLRAPQIASNARAGQFVHILPRDTAACDPFLRRAFSILSVNGESFDILYRVEGRGTSLMSNWHIGDEVQVLGPLGNGFEVLPNSPRRALLVGGGVGVPPLVLLAAKLHREGRIGGDVAIVGARSGQEVLCSEDFARYLVPVQIVTNDGSLGRQGLVTDALRDELLRDSNATVYACGPLPMLRAVAMLCMEFQVPSQVSLEENMPCGVGVCNGCVVAVNGATDDYGRYRRICVEGPVLNGADIDWAGEAM